MKKLFAMLAAAVLVASVGFAQTLTVSPVKLAASGTILSGATAASAVVYNSGTGTSYYTVSVPTSQTWMSVSPASGDSTGEYDTVTVTYVTTGQVAGIYSNNITITQTNATVQVKTIPVTLTIDEDLNQGVAIGPSSEATAASGIAIGDRVGRAIALGVDAIQIGGGVNSSTGTVYIRSWQLLTPAGLIPAVRLSAVAINGSGITNLNASNLASGSIPGARIAATTITNSMLATGIDSAKLLAGSAVSAINGAAITNIPATAITPAGLSSNLAIIVGAGTTSTLAIANGRITGITPQ